MGGWLKKHAYAFLLGGVLIIAIWVSACLDGTPSSLPDVALGSKILLHVERVFAILIVAFFVLVIVVRAWKGELPYKISKDGFEAKLTYIAKHMLAADGCCVMRVDGYITDREAETLSQVMTMRDELLDASPASQKSEFLRDANNVVKNIRASVFYGLVQKTFESNDWDVDPIRTKRKRADLHARDGEGQQFRVVPRFAMGEESTILSGELKRLEGLAGEHSKRGRVLIVVPDRSQSSLDADGDPAVLKLSEFMKLLGLDVDPRSASTE